MKNKTRSTSKVSGDASNDIPTRDVSKNYTSDKFETSHAALTGRNRGFWRSREYSFRAALAGARHTLFTQPNAWIEIAAGVMIAIFGWALGISALEWGMLGFTIFCVLAFEAVNTALESVVDLVSPDFHPLAKIAKDSAAGAMIFVVLGSLCVALAIFGTRLLALWRG